ncbi:hypothetical protein [Sorangium atrum]|uniref:Secreted protein n=1 Tax=Sorangium atrum TaxID=2995308 RepID=A0ABT5CAQ1_9BACT|nr:hypothetical protein [Sorangium aterium]MDC0682718.1 hypothetical protein [Sorangium aterium]
MKIRVLALPLFMFTSAASASAPPPNFSQQVYLCNSHLQAKVDISFGQTTSTATVQSQSGQVKDNPFVPGIESGMEYAVFVASSVKPSSTASWSTLSAQQAGLVGTPQAPISTGNSTFLNSSSCQIQGTVIISTGCPSASGMNQDYKTIERTWVGCGL